MAAHRYWRILFTASTDGWTSAAEYQFRIVSGGSNVISGGTPSASDTSIAPNNPPAACDGSTATYWSSANNTMPHWWEYDFGAGVTKAIVEFVIISRPTGAYQGTGTNFQLQYSDDNSTWITAGFPFSGVTWTSNGQTQVFTLTEELAVSKLVGYAVLDRAAGVNVTKAVAYAVLDTIATPSGGYAYCFAA